MKIKFLKEESRNHIECLVDMLLQMFLISETYINGITKLQKITFLTEHRLVSNRIKALNHRFYLHHYGPFSRSLYDDYDYLMANGIIVEESGVQITKTGKRILAGCEPLFKKNKEIMTEIRSSVRKFGPLPFDTLIGEVYNMEIVPLKGSIPVKISAIPKGEDLLRKLETSEAQQSFSIDDEWVDTLDILLDNNALTLLKLSETDMKEGKVFSHEEVFGKL